MIKVMPIGGYGEVGKNMTAIDVDGKIVILDMGIHLPNYIECTQDEDIRDLDPNILRESGAIPDDSILNEKVGDVVGIIPTHAHLDHIGAIPYIASRYKCPILCTRFTSEVIKAIVTDERIRLKNKIEVLGVNSTYQITPDIKVEFVNVTHSTPQTVCVALHTKYGVVLYSNDFKFDNHPTIGQKPNYKRFRELGEKGVLLLITDSLYAQKEGKMPGELVVREMLKEVILDTDSDGKAVVITTFASHLARLKSIIEFSGKLNRKLVFLGRSLSKYVSAGEAAGIIKFDVEKVKYGNQVRRKLKEIIKKGIDKYVLIVTGHQGEAQATLSKMTTGELPFEFKEGDHVIFSCRTIPTKININNRAELENRLKSKKVHIFKDIHYSGHAAREDLRDFLGMLKPMHVVPAHSPEDRMDAFRTLALEEGISESKIHLLYNGDELKL